MGISEQTRLAAENTRKAYELRERVSEREKVLHRGLTTIVMSPVTWKRRARVMNFGRRPIHET